MKRLTHILGICGVLCSTAAVARAQDIFSPAGIGYQAAFNGWPAGFGGYGGGTPEGNYLAGVASTIYSLGSYNESTSRAAINYETARGQYIENQRRFTEAYFALREVNQARRAEKLARAKISPEVLATHSSAPRPRPLGGEALDPVTKELLWPEALKSEEYALERRQIDEAIYGLISTGSGDALAIQRAARAMVRTLQSNIRNLPTGDYLAARKFLDSLEWTARMG